VIVGYYIYLENLGINGRLILKRLTELWCEGVVWFQLNQDRFQLWAFVNTIISGFYERCKITYHYFTGCKIFSF